MDCNDIEIRSDRLNDVIVSHINSYNKEYNFRQRITINHSDIYYSALNSRIWFSKQGNWFLETTICEMSFRKEGI